MFGFTMYSRMGTDICTEQERKSKRTLQEQRRPMSWGQDAIYPSPSTNLILPLSLL